MSAVERKFMKKHSLSLSVDRASCPTTFDQRTDKMSILPNKPTDISYDLIIVGGGAAGMFAAAVCAEANPDLKILVLEKGENLLAKVRISGGGRCNLTHECSDIRSFVKNYPRGGSELIGPFHRFGPHETMEWFEAHGVPVLTLDDGCVFPRADSSDAIIQALLKTASLGSVEIKTKCEVTKIQVTDNSEFTVIEANGDDYSCNHLLIATGGGAFIEGLRHTIEKCVPSLFSFNTPDSELKALAGIVIENVELKASGINAEGTLLITHSGVSGPAILRLSSFGASHLRQENYCFEMQINWSPSLTEEKVFQILSDFKNKSPHKQIGTWSPIGLSSRLWHLIVSRANIDHTQEWGQCPNKSLRHIATQVCAFKLQINGKNKHKEEFVTCGGIQLKEINFKTMESRIKPGLYFAGEVLNIDGLTGGFNLQAAWTTGYLAACDVLA